MIVFIPSAGTGERVNYHNPNINKTLIPYKNKPIISHIIESYPINFKFLIGLGYEGKILKNYLKIAHPERNIIFYNVSIFKGKRASLTRTINEGIKYIQEPFIFHANDMIVNYSIKNYEENFAVIDKKNKNFDLYRFFKIKGKKINMYEKSKNVRDKNFCFPYLGVSFIKDYKIFKEILTISKEKSGEVEFFKKYSNLKMIYCQSFLDFGNPKTLDNINKYNFLDKKDEYIYFIKNNVIKFSINKEKNLQKYKRSKIIKNFLPEDIRYKNNFLIYKFENGILLNQNYKYLKKFLNFLYDKFWFKYYKLRTQKKFQDNCYKFYYDKTFSRIKLLNELNKLEKIKILNGIKVKSIFDYLNQIDWLDISNGKQCNFHGDLHGSNIIFKNNKFTLLDWREKFGNDMYTGDIYYELGKLYHGIIVDHEFVSKSEFKINIFKNTASIKPKIDNNLKCANRIFWEFIKNKKFNEKKIIIITGLIFINISPLHSKHYRSFLYLLGKYMLATHERFKHTYTY